MEASSLTHGHATSARPAPPPGPGERLARGLVEPVGAVVREAGSFAAFVGRTLRELGGVWRYTAEILRQSGNIIVGSALVIWAMQFVMGTICGYEGNYILRGYGASTYSGVLTAFCSVREMGPYMWGYIVAAKIGCGLAAEIGSMRINDELDAVEAQGLNPMQYVVATRFVAALLTFPLLYLVGLAFHVLGQYVVIVLQIHEVSQGGWETVHWGFITPLDILFSEAKIMVSGLLIVLVGMYYGYHASGGPVGVGAATARSMILSLLLIHITGALLTMVFWGLSPNTPIGG